MKYYYKLYKDTPYVGTDETILISSDNSEYEIDVDEIKEELLNDYGYLEGDDMTEEQEEEFKEKCEVHLTSISEENFYAMVEDGYYWAED